MTWRKSSTPIEPKTPEEAYRIEQIINSLVTKSIELSVIQGKLQVGGIN